MDERTIAGVCGAMNHLTEVLRRKADVFKAEAEGPIAELRANDFLYLAEAFEAQVRDLHRAAGFDENGGAK